MFTRSLRLPTSSCPAHPQLALVCPSSPPDGEHPQDLGVEEPSGDDLLRPAQRRPSGRRVSSQGPEHGRLPDRGAHPGLLRPAAGRT